MFGVEYVHRRTTAEAEAGRVCPGDTVHLADDPLFPVDFAAVLHRRAAELHEVRVPNYPPLGPLALLTDPAYGGALQMESISYNTYQQEAQHLGRCAFLPNHLRNAARDWTHGAPEYDYLVFTVSSMDKRGCSSLAGSVCIELEVFPRARRMVVEAASRAPRIFRDMTLHAFRVDAIVESDRYPAALSPQPPGEVNHQPGRVVAKLVRNGAAIRLGFGSTINALAAELEDKRGLGIRTEAMSDAVMGLLRRGVADNSRKSLHQGKTIICSTMGGHVLCDFVDDNLIISHKALSYTNDLSVLAANQDMTSINAALRVDLTGQYASESAGPRQILGSGGQVGIAVDAQMVPRGKSVITLRFTYPAKDPDTGERRPQFRILPVLPEGIMVTFTRSNIHFVTIEYGAVCLWGLMVSQRIKAPISTAHPDFRDWLEEGFRRVCRLWRSVRMWKQRAVPEPKGSGVAGAINRPFG